MYASKATLTLIMKNYMFLERDIICRTNFHTDTTGNTIPIHEERFCIFTFILLLH